MDAKVEQFYRDILSDLTIDREESLEMKDFFTELNPPPDKLVYLRATAFQVGCEFLQENDNEANVRLLRCINLLVHYIESICMKPKSSSLGFDTLDMETQVEEFYKETFSDLTIDRDESKELYDFFGSKKIPSNKLVGVRAAVFKVACDFLSETDTSTNVSLMRCMNYVVHVFEQNYLEGKSYELQMEPSPTISVESVGLDASIEKAVQYLWDLDMNRLNPNRDYEVNIQKGKKPYYKGDGAKHPLFKRVDRDALRRPTYKAFIALLDNYNAQVGQAEVVTSTEKKEVSTFIDAIMETAPMQFCHKYLAANKPEEIPSSVSEFKKLLHKIWFKLYRRSRGGRNDSSGFEHVFVGEIKNGEVSGFHNWINFYLEEKRGSVDYFGYIKPRSKSDAHTDNDDQIITLQFTWNGVMKKVGTMFLGVSPEFEMALYTLCFLMGNEGNKLTITTGYESFEMNIKCFTYAHDKLGTSFPEVMHHYEE